MFTKESSGYKPKFNLPSDALLHHAIVLATAEKASHVVIDLGCYDVEYIRLLAEKTKSSSPFVRKDSTIHFAYSHPTQCAELCRALDSELDTEYPGEKFIIFISPCVPTAESYRLRMKRKDDVTDSADTVKAVAEIRREAAVTRPAHAVTTPAVAPVGCFALAWRALFGMPVEVPPPTPAASAAKSKE